jgi:hypothetical protein
MDRHARQIRSAARSLRPASRRGRSVRRTVLDTMSMLKVMAAGTRQWSRSVRRHNHRAAGKQRNGVLFGLAFGVFLPLAGATGDAGLSQASL